MRIHPRLRRYAAVASALALTPAVTLAAASPSHSAGPILFNVVGTSDVSDSQLMSAVIKPGFEKAYPQYNLNYQGTGTTNAITVAESGGAAALIVHAASVENQFVDQGFSLEPFGRSIFWGDYVLVGPTADPVGVSNGTDHDVVGAFKKVAAAGAAGQATFNERTASPGTSIQERQIWALTSGVPLCTVGAAAGGGARPTNGPTTCTDPDQNNSYPSWYSGAAGTQAANLARTSSCVAQGRVCYAFTDRGTFNYLQSTGSLANLKIVTRDNSPAATGGREALINAFHAYGINPAKFTGANKTDPVAAKLFLDFITSPAEQQAIGQYLGAAKPFVPAAAPILTTDVSAARLTKSGKTVVTGNLANAVPGYPALSSQEVNLLETKSGSPLAIPKVIASGATNQSGNYRITARLKAGRYYSVGVPELSKIEVPGLTPIFADTLQPTATALGPTAHVALRNLRVSAKGIALIKGRVRPGVVGPKGRVMVYATAQGKKIKRIARVKLKDGATSFALRVRVPTGRVKVQVVYLNSAQDQIPSTSRIKTVTIP